MPELPDVELYRQVAERGLHRHVARVDVPDQGSLKGLSPAAVQNQLHNRALHAARRHGKLLFLEFANASTLAMHFGTNGALQYVTSSQPEPKFVRVCLVFNGGDRLAYINPRRIGHIQVVDSADAFIAEEDLGPDVLAAAFTFADFTAALAGSRQNIKALLMDQSRMAGIGNIYSDEILFHARLHPARVAARLDDATRHRVFDAIRSVLRTAVACGAGAEGFTDRLPQDYLLPQRRAGGQCPRCGTGIRSSKFGGRTAYYCPTCQQPP